MKSICQQHDRAYETSEGCPYCEKPKGAVAVLAQSTPVAAVACTYPLDTGPCGKPAAWRWHATTAAARAAEQRIGVVAYCAQHDAGDKHGFYGSNWSFEAIP